jgi:hypothetical protein
VPEGEQDVDILDAADHAPVRFAEIPFLVDLGLCHFDLMVRMQIGVGVREVLSCPLNQADCQQPRTVSVILAGWRADFL